MLECEFEEIARDKEGGGFGLETAAHQAAILRRTAESWRYAGFIPKRQRAGGYIETIDLVFERQAVEK